jgi:hypothetical protein
MFWSLNIEIHAAQAPALRVGFICNLMLEIWDFISSRGFKKWISME